MDMRKLWVAAVAAGMLAAGQARAEIFQLDWTADYTAVGSIDIVTSGAGDPFGIETLPVITGTMTVDNNKSGGDAIVDLSFTTGSIDWTISDLNRASSSVFFDGTTGDFQVLNAVVQ